ncbi:MAG TPA: TIGR04283 family arsenosugar biosynthesis glycosyltransferase, partial [Ramlibacter sp.]
MTSLRIVVPALNEGASLAGFLDRLLPLRGRGAEVVVADGGSTDETWAIAAHRADCVLLAPRGRAAQMNRGSRGATAEVLLFLHADTVLPDDAGAWIEHAVRRGALWGRFDVRIDSRHPLLRLAGAAMNLRSRLTGLATGDQAIFVLRDVFERAGGFPDLPLMEDV